MPVICKLFSNLQVMVSLGTHAHGLGEALGAEGEEHELLHGELVAGVGTAVDDVENWNGHQHLLSFVASQIGQVAKGGGLG